MGKCFCPTRLTECQAKPCPWPDIERLIEKNYLQAWLHIHMYLRILTFDLFFASVELANLLSFVLTDQVLPVRCSAL